MAKDQGLSFLPDKNGVKTFLKLQLNIFASIKFYEIYFSRLAAMPRNSNEGFFQNSTFLP
jgi:hypothetical protein